MNSVQLNPSLTKKPLGFKNKIDIRQFIIIFALVVIWVGFEILTKGTFLSPRNLSSLFTQMSYIAIIAVGMVLIIVAGYIDLSVGSIVAVCGAVSAIMQVKMGFGAIPAIIVPIIIGIILTAWNGVWASYQKVPAFIVTLASMLMFRGLVLIITKGSTIAGLTPEFKFIGVGYVTPLLSIIIAVVGMGIYLTIVITKRFEQQKRGIEVQSSSLFFIKLIGLVAAIAVFVILMTSYQGIPVPVIILIATTIIIAFISLQTRFGRRLYAIGGNPEAARLSGINVKKEAFKIYLVLGALSAIAGLILTARLDGATPSAGTSFEFDAISAAVIGGASFLGGEGTVFGAIIGALIMASLDNGMSLMGWDTSVKFIVKGLVLLLAVWFDIKVRTKGRA